MDEIQQLIIIARRIIATYTNAAAPQFNQLAGEGRIAPAVLSANRLFVSSAMTTDAIIILLEHGLIWDALALFRPLLEGTARFCYLLSASTEEEEKRRCREFEELLEDKSMAGLDQRVGNLKKSHLYKHDKTDAYLDRLETSVHEAIEATNDEASIARRKWRFFELSNQLRHECREWDIMADQWELRYATANFAIHKESLAIVDADVEIGQQTVGSDTLELKAWGPSLLSFCVMLVRDRLAVFMRRLKLNETVLLDGMQQYCVFSRIATDLELVGMEKLRHSYSKIDKEATLNKPPTGRRSQDGRQRDGRPQDGDGGMR